MKKKKSIILIVAIFLLASMISIIMGANCEHLSTCHEENCCTCDLIKYAIIFNQNLNYFIKYIISVDVIILLVCSFIFADFEIKNKTLIELKVRLDE